MQETAMSMAQLEEKTKEELLELSTEMGIENSALRREEIVFNLLEAYAKQQGYVLATGLLEIVGDGYGFLRQQGLRAGPGDVTRSPRRSAASPGSATSRTRHTACATRLPPPSSRTESPRPMLPSC